MHFCTHARTYKTTNDVKAEKYGIQKPSTCRATLLRFKFLVDDSRFSPCRNNLSRNKLKKVVAQSRARVNFAQQILALLFVFHQTLNLSRNKFVVMPQSWSPDKANEPISVLHFFYPQQMFLLRDKLILQGEKRKTSTKHLKRSNVARQV